MVLRTNILKLSKEKLFTSERTPNLLVADFLDSAHKILDYTQDLSFESFITDSKIVDSVIRNFEVIGEAANL